MGFILEFLGHIAAVYAVFQMAYAIYARARAILNPSHNHSLQGGFVNIDPNKKPEMYVKTFSAKSMVGLFMVLLAFGHIMWLEYGPDRAAVLITGDAASLAGSVLLAGLGVVMIRD